MTNEQQQVREWMKAFGQETPEKPTIPSLEVRKLRAKLILEEALETVTALGLYCDPESGEFEEDPISSRNLSLKDIADGCEDLKVVTEGTLVACGLVDNRTVCLIAEQYDDPLFNEVMRSNWSKMWTTEEVRNTFGIHPDSEVVYGVWKNGRKYSSKVEQYYTWHIIQLIVDCRITDKWLVKDSSGKVIKSPSYSPANLTPIIEEMSK